MTTLLLRLAAPLQSWGDSSRFGVRRTRPEPTRSGVLGLVAAAAGRRRSDPIEDLLGLRFGVRVDQPGVLLGDYHTVSTISGRPLPSSAGGESSYEISTTRRFYIADGVFLAGLDGEDDQLRSLRVALLRPAFSLGLGRRSCPPVPPLVLGLREGSLTDSLAAEPWQASRWQQRRRSDPQVELSVVVDDENGLERMRDVPLDRSLVSSSWGWRVVRRYTVVVGNPAGEAASVAHHDPMSLLG